MRFELAFGCARGAIVGAGGEGWLGLSTPVDSDKQNLICRLVLASAYSHANLLYLYELSIGQPTSKIYA